MYLRKDYGDYKIIQTGKRTQEHLYIDNEGRILFLGEYSNYKKVVLAVGKILRTRVQGS